MFLTKIGFSGYQVSHNMYIDGLSVNLSYSQLPVIGLSHFSTNIPWHRPAAKEGLGVFAIVLLKAKAPTLSIGARYFTNGIHGLDHLMADTHVAPPRK